MTDRELLEFAAKAAGIDGIFRETPSKAECGIGTHYAYKWWNPLNNDGDALRLAVLLEITPSKHNDTIVPSRSAAWRNGNAYCSLWEPVLDDPYQSTRRAIVRAAAEIGKTK